MSLTKRWLETLYITEVNDDNIPDDQDLLYWELLEKEEDGKEYNEEDFYEEFQ